MHTFITEIISSLNFHIMLTQTFTHFSLLEVSLFFAFFFPFSCMLLALECHSCVCGFAEGLLFLSWFCFFQVIVCI